VNGLPSVTVVWFVRPPIGDSLWFMLSLTKRLIFTKRGRLQLDRLQQNPNRSQLPQGIHPPEISPLVSPLGTILQYAFTVNGQGETSLMDLRRLVDVTLRNQILRVPGVSQVTIYGGDERENQATVNPQLLRSRQVSLNEVTAAARSAPSNAPGGFGEGGVKSYSSEGSDR